MTTRRHAIATTVGLVAAPGTWAQGFPNKPVRLVVGFAPGGAIDGVARTLATSLTEKLGQTFIVENKGGSVGRLAIDEVRKAPPDGYTLLVAGAEVMGAQGRRDLEPVAQLVSVPHMLVASPSSKLKSAKDILGGQFKLQASGFFAYYVSVKVLGAKVTDPPGNFNELISSVSEGTYDAAIIPASSLLNQEARKLRILAVTEQVKGVDAPTFAQAGLPSPQFEAFIGLFGPRNLDPAARNRLVAAAEGVRLEAFAEKSFFTPRFRGPQAFAGSLTPVAATICDDKAYCEKTDYCQKPC